MLPPEWASRIRESRFFSNVYIRGLGAFMLICCVCSLSQQYAFVSVESLDSKKDIHDSKLQETISLAIQNAEGMLDDPEEAESWKSPEPFASLDSVTNQKESNMTPALSQVETQTASVLPTLAPTIVPVPAPKAVLPPSPKEELVNNTTFEQPKIKPAVKSTAKPIKKPTPIAEPRQAVKKNSKGILLCLHDGIMELGLSLIRELRCLGNKEPIEVHHCHDLTKPSIDLLYGLDDNIQVVDLCERYIMKKVLSEAMAKTFQSYWIKPLAVHYTSFEELIYLDADAILLKNPATLRSNEGYKKHGTLFFYDRVINTNQYLNKRTNRGMIYLHQWLKTFDYKRFGLNYTAPSSAFKASFAYRGKTAHEQDSSMILINKGKAGKAMNVLWYLITEHRFIYEFSWGDKESFWLSYEFSHTPYFFSPYGASVVSATPNKDMQRHPDTLCGSLAHFDPTLNTSAPAELLYVNGRSLVDPVPFRLHKLKQLQPNLVFNMLPTHVTPRQRRRAPAGMTEWFECMTGMGSTPVPPHFLPNLWRRRQHFQAISMGYIEPLLVCSNPGDRLPDVPAPKKKSKR
ncbi:Alpha-mannosyltransferase [Plasmopara halstedii]|uniref:Alpha-mannosyltransferase n=1 Tax=Plasmopara halstedii TaxID=4781 RepID=A0A0P1AK59_PLAHL|nr:Alpha-mannosyltransferase [Plasmopara halstedii]CEG41296.1 Alpha-mannosyltransferase [Plasmopara halstedii]|eukprot:XP_024577665.1 Alpha-mannosyltransferase [Plasmopara halstedii]